MKKTELTLPEWAFLDAHSHLGDQLEGRDVILHVRTNTILEVFDQNLVSLNPEIKMFRFKHKNHFGIIEPKIITVLYTFAPDDIDEIMKKAAIWYCDYLDWTDTAIEEDATGLMN